MLTLAKIDEMYALGVAPNHRNFFYTCTNECATTGNEHRLVFRRNDARAHDRAVACADLNRNHTLTAAAVFRVLGERRALAVAVARRRQHRGRSRLLRTGNDQRGYRLLGLERKPAHP